MHSCFNRRAGQWLHFSISLMFWLGLFFLAACKKGHFLVSSQVGHAPIVVPNTIETPKVPMVLDISGGMSLFVPETFSEKGFGIGYTKRFVTWNDHHLWNDFGLHIYHLSKPFRFHNGNVTVNPKGPWTVSSRYVAFVLYNPHKPNLLPFDLSAQASGQLHYRLRAFKEIPYHISAGVQVEGPNTAFTDDRSMFVAWTIGVSVLTRRYVD